MYVGETDDTKGTYHTHRGFLGFTALSGSPIVVAGNLRLRVLTTYSNDSISVVQGTQESASSLTGNDFDNVGSTSAGGFSTGTAGEVNISANATMCGILAAGKLALRSEIDRSNGTYAQYYPSLATENHATSTWRPYLTTAYFTPVSGRAARQNGVARFYGGHYAATAYFFRAQTGYAYAIEQYYDDNPGYIRLVKYVNGVRTVMQEDTNWGSNHTWLVVDGSSIKVYVGYPFSTATLKWDVTDTQVPNAGQWGPQDASTWEPLYGPLGAIQTHRFTVSAVPSATAVKSGGGTTTPKSVSVAATVLPSMSRTASLHRSVSASAGAVPRVSRAAALLRSVRATAAALARVSHVGLFVRLVRAATGVVVTATRRAYLSVTIAASVVASATKTAVLHRTVRSVASVVASMSRLATLARSVGASASVVTSAIAEKVTGATKVVVRAVAQVILRPRGGA